VDHRYPEAECDTQTFKIIERSYKKKFTTPRKVLISGGSPSLSQLCCTESLSLLQTIKIVVMFATKVRTKFIANASNYYL
jgi:hypothetical protein